MIKNEDKQKVAQQLLQALKTSGEGGVWLNPGNLEHKAQRGVTPFENIVKALGTDIAHPQQSTQSSESLKAFETKVDAFVENVKKHLVPVETSEEGADYDSAKGVIFIPQKEAYDNIHEYAHDFFTAASLATGTPDRLNRPGVVLENETSETLPISSVREQLVGELVTAAMCIEEGQAASLAPSSVDTVEEWEKYIADNPEHFDGIMDDVNKAVYALHEIKRGRKPDYEKVIEKANTVVTAPEQSAAVQEQLKLKSQTEKKAAERQIALLSAALSRAQERDRIWMNPDSKLYPSFYPKGPAISPFNAISLTLHSDENRFRSNLYTTFQEAKTRKEGVKASEKGVPFNWYNWSSYINRNNPDEKISRKDYLALSKEEKAQFKGIHNREIRTLFNLDQTMTPQVDPEHYNKALGWNGGEKERKPGLSEHQIRRDTFAQFLDCVNKNLVTIETHATHPVARYDMRHDVVSIPSEGAFARYHDYVHDTVAEIVRATGHPERLARETAVNRNSQDDINREELVVELATGVKMLELGMPARLSNQSLNMVEDWKRELQEDPRLIDIIESDVNNALEVMNKAERGEKVEYSSFINQQKAQQFQDKQKPQVSSAEGLILADIIRHHGMEIPDGNFNSPEEKTAFMEKFGLSYYHEQMNYARQMTNDEDPEVVEAAYSDIYNHAANIDQMAREYRPADWNIKGRRDIEESIHDLMDADPRELIIIFDEKNRKADVILPQGAFMGGKVIMPDGKERNFHVSPDEVLCKEEKKTAKIQYNEAAGFSKNRIDHALDGHPKFKPEFVRYFNREGAVGFHADDRYFEGKQLYTARLNQWMLDDVRNIDIRDKVELSRHPQFDRILMTRDDDGRWMMFIQAQNEQPFGVYPDRADLNKYFTAAHQGDASITAAVRQELGAKYYEMAKVKPSLQVNVLGEKATEEDASRLQRVNIFKNKRGQFMIIAKVTDPPKDMAPREITNAQWQRLWLSPDHEQYKKDLAAHIFADVLHPERVQAQKVEEEPKKENTLTPSDLAARAMELKSQRNNTIILLHVGDFLEAYLEDAQKVAKALGLRLSTSSEMKDATGKPITVTGFPYDQQSTMLPRIVRETHNRVAIAELDANQQKAQIVSEQEPVRSHGMHR